jgi:uncharacterized protein (DUF305 family)
MPESAPTLNRAAKDAIVPNSLVIPWGVGLARLRFCSGTDTEAVATRHSATLSTGQRRAWCRGTILVKNDAAMTAMMTAMTIQPSGDVDHDFAEMMVPHHQDAIGMVQALLRFGHNERPRRLAQEIIITQQHEVVAMRFA